MQFSFLIIARKNNNFPANHNTISQKTTIPSLRPVCFSNQAAESVRMTLCDHIILADEQYYSFKDNKKL